LEGGGICFTQQKIRPGFGGTIKKIGPDWEWVGKKEDHRYQEKRDRKKGRPAKKLSPKGGLVPKNFPQYGGKGHQNYQEKTAT